MSAKPEAHSGHDPHAEGDDADHAADPALPEPASPAWLPLLGGGLFLLALLVFLASEQGAEPADAEQAEQAKQAEPMASAEALAPAPPSSAPRAPTRSAFPADRPRPVAPLRLVDPQRSAGAPSPAAPPIRRAPALPGRGSGAPPSRAAAGTPAR